MVSNRFYGPICQVRDWFDGERRVFGASNAATVSVSPALASPACWFQLSLPPPRVIAPEAAFTALRSRGGTATLSSATAIAAYSWPYGPASNADQHLATIGGSRLEIIRPSGSSPTLPSAQQVCDAMRAVPAVQRLHTSRVILCPTSHPSSTARTTVGGEAGSGVVVLFPLRSAITQNDVDNRIMHEIGHNYQGVLWRSAADVSGWGAAAALDAQAPSTYARSNFGDDFCEFLIVFNTVRGTPCESAGRTMFRYRWEKMLTY